MQQEFFIRCSALLLKDKHVSELFELLIRDDLTDIELVIGRQRTVMNVHSTVLAASSEFFQAIFSANEWKEQIIKTVELPELEPWAVQAVVAWMYTGHCCPDCFLYKQSLIWVFPIFASPLQILITLRYFLIWQSPFHELIRQGLCEALPKQDPTEQIKSWINIQSAAFDDITLGALTVLTETTNNFQHFLALVKATDEVNNMNRILKIAIRRRKFFETCSNLVQLMKYLAEWVETKRGVEDVNGLKVILFDLISSWGEE
ncbi:hypothetical protein HDV00_000851 [Rhizophlyctis rosea]|nr:hypothetical protein HDV00_000851 [Rhizophlyctis rosea]